ncbi:exo-alpha-sialidase [Trypanosoma cruzi]|nr:exo-alpha-sialidase [Trypanosoma cruzi]
MTPHSYSRTVKSDRPHCYTAGNWQQRHQLHRISAQHHAHVHRPSPKDEADPYPFFYSKYTGVVTSSTSLPSIVTVVRPQRTPYPFRPYELPHTPQEPAQQLRTKLFQSQRADVLYGFFIAFL